MRLLLAFLIAVSWTGCFDDRRATQSGPPRLFDLFGTSGCEASFGLTALCQDLPARWVSSGDGDYVSPLSFCPSEPGVGSLVLGGTTIPRQEPGGLQGERGLEWTLDPGTITHPLGRNEAPIRLSLKENKASISFTATLPEQAPLPVTRLLNVTLRGNRAFNRYPALRITVKDRAFPRIVVPHPKPRTYTFAFDQEDRAVEVKMELALVEASIPVWDDLSEDTASLQIDAVTLRDRARIVLHGPPADTGILESPGVFTWAEVPDRAFSGLEQAFACPLPPDLADLYLKTASMKNERLDRVLMPAIRLRDRAVFFFPLTFEPGSTLSFSVGLPPIHQNHTFVKVQARPDSRANDPAVLLDEAITLPLLDPEGEWRSFSLPLPEGIEGPGRLEFRFASTPTDEATQQDTDWRGQHPSFALFGNPRISRAAVRGASDPPNAVVVCIDTLRADHLSCYGYPYETSPCIDRFSKDCLCFTQAMSTSSWTLPSHIAFLGGMPLGQHGGLFKDRSMLQGVPTLAEELRKRGYRTAAFVGGGYVSADFGMDRGFDYFDESSLVISAGLPKVSAWVKEVKDKGPFFLFFHFFDVHSPYGDRADDPRAFFEARGQRFDADLAKEIEEGKYAFEPNCGRFKVHVADKVRRHMIGLYDADIAATDALMGRFFELLDEEGVRDQTAVIITSDHGEEFGEHGNWYHSKHLYREVVHVPLLVRLPGALAGPGRKIDAPVSTLDIAPTLLALTGAAAPPSWYGVSLLETAGDPGGQRARQILSENVIAQGGKTVKMMTLQGGGTRYFRTFCDEGASYPDGERGFVNGERQELYFIDPDPGETVDLAPLHPDLIRERNKESRLLGAKLKADQARQTPAGSQPMSEEVMERLKALGYMK